MAAWSAPAGIAWPGASVARTSTDSPSPARWLARARTDFDGPPWRSSRLGTIWQTRISGGESAGLGPVLPRPARHAGANLARRQILHHHRARADDAEFADGHARPDEHVRPEPGVAADGDRLG